MVRITVNFSIVIQYKGYFVCADGTSLRYDSDEPNKFYCPSTQTYYTGEPYASSWVR